MKKLFYLVSVLAIALIAVPVVSCSDDKGDELYEEFTNPGDGSGGTQTPVLGEWQSLDNGRTMVYTVNMAAGAGSATWTLHFDEQDICTSSSYAVTFNNSYLADAYWAGVQDEEGISRSGNTITHDYTTTHVGLTKEQALAATGVGTGGGGLPGILPGEGEGEGEDEGGETPPAAELQWDWEDTLFGAISNCTIVVADVTIEWELTFTPSETGVCTGAEERYIFLDEAAAQTAFESLFMSQKILATREANVITFDRIRGFKDLSRLDAKLKAESYEFVFGN